MFIIRTIFWLSLVIAFIPVSKDELGDNQRIVSTQETISVVQSTYRDLSQFCARNPQTCGTGKELFSQFGVKAKTGAELVYSFLDEKFGTGVEEASPGEILQPDSFSTGSIMR
jgi:hypothetical protein